MAEIKFTENKKTPQFKTGFVWLGVLAVLLLVILLNCFTIVNEGFIGVKYRFGKIVQDDLAAGLQFKIAFIEEIRPVDIRNQIYVFEGDAYTKDTQSVKNLQLKVTYRYIQSDLSNIIQNVGIDNVQDRFLVPNVQKIAKDAIGKVQAEELVQSRSEVQAIIETELAKALEDMNAGILITGFAIENLAFDEAFENSIQAKVIAAQDALKMENKTREREEEAKQVVIAAEAEADSTLVKAEAQAKAIELIQAQISDSPNYIEYLKITNWDGVLPQVISDGVNPFIVLDGSNSLTGGSSDSSSSSSGTQTESSTSDAQE